MITKNRAMLLALATVAATGVGAAAPAAAASSSWRCSGTLTDSVVRGDLVVPAGTACRLDRVRVLGEVDVHGNLLALSSVLRQGADVQGDGYLNAYATSIGGDLTVAGWGAYVDRSTVRGDVEVSGGETDVYVTGAQVGGDYRHRARYPASIRDTRIRGSLDTGGQLFYANGLSVEGPANLSSNDIVISGSTFASPSSFRASVSDGTMLLQDSRFRDISTRGYWSYLYFSAVKGTASDGTSYNLQGSGNTFGSVQDKWATCFPGGRPDSIDAEGCSAPAQAGRAAAVGHRAAENSRSRHEAKKREAEEQLARAGRARR